MSIEGTEDVSRWYVLHTHPKQEERAINNLSAWGVETLDPKLRTRRYNQFTGAVSFVTQPLFPRYIFAKFNRQQLPRIWFTRGVHHVVSFGGTPASVDEGVIEIIHARIDENGFVRSSRDLKRGDKVAIKAGPFRNLMGIFERKLKADERITVLLTTVNYQGHLVVGRDLVERVTG